MEPISDRKTSSRRFPTTSWTFIEAAKDPENALYPDALGQFASEYWKPVYYFLRARGYSPERSEELTQEFFCRFQERNWMVPADRTRGKFRSFLLRILVRFLSDQSMARAPKQHGFENRQIPISQWLTAEDRSFEPSTRDTPESIFMRQWAITVMKRVSQRLNQQCANEGRVQWYELFCERFDAESKGQKLSIEELGARFAMSKDQVRYAVRNVSQRFRDLLKDELLEQTGSEADVEEEIGSLIQLLSS